MPFLRHFLAKFSVSVSPYLPGTVWTEGGGNGTFFTELIAYEFIQLSIPVSWLVVGSLEIYIYIIPFHEIP